MSDSELPALRERAARGDRDAIDELIERAAERGDFEELRRLADGGSRDAVDQLVELAAEKGDTEELQRLAAAGSQDAADVLAELSDESPPTTTSSGCVCCERKPATGDHGRQRRQQYGVVVDTRSNP